MNLTKESMNNLYKVKNSINNKPQLVCRYELKTGETTIVSKGTHFYIKDEKPVDYVPPVNFKGECQLRRNRAHIAKLILQSLKFIGFKENPQFRIKSINGFKISQI